MASLALDSIRVLSREAVEEPHQIWEALREEAPVHWDEGLGGVFVSRYEDVHKVLMDPLLYSSRVGAMTAAPPIEAVEIIAKGLPPANTLITADPPEHMLYRKLVSRAFTPRRVERLRESIRALADSLIDEFAEAGEVELLSQFAVPLPLAIIAEQLGVPRTRMSDFKAWSDAYMNFIGGLASKDLSIQCAREIIECQEYFTGKLDEYRDDPPDNMLGVMLRATLGDERPLNTAEMSSILSQFMLAGNETSTASIAATWHHLIRQPDMLKEVREDRSLIPNGSIPTGRTSGSTSPSARAITTASAPAWRASRARSRSRRCSTASATCVFLRTRTTSSTTRSSSRDP